MRFWEIDFARGIAVILMVLFNWVFALAFFRLVSFESWPFWILFPRVIASAFIAISGVAVTISLSRSKRKPIVRGLQIFAVGLAITAVTWIFVPSAPVYFGVLHLIGISMILAPAIAKLSSGALAVAGVVVVIIGLVLSLITFDFPWLLWLGLAPAFSSLDYFPLLPWFGVFLVGMALGKKFYVGGKRKFAMREMHPRERVFAFLGRHSLLIYIAHIPVLLIALYVLGFHWA